MFPFQKVYDQYTKPLDGIQLEANPPFGPVLMTIKMVDGKPKILGLIPPIVTLAFFIKQNGKELLDEFINGKMKAEDNDDLCMVLMHEGFMKWPNGDMNEEQKQAMRQKGLMNDPQARYVILVCIYHRSGMRVGFLPLSNSKRISYAPMLDDDEPTLIHVSNGVDQNLH